ncbi:hypothetical protein WOLCODRAFT_162519 [Wolfiporia cocos MD-104 SS10]|uniref:NADAR domain-containing protein n=1 Tax=Wolfiporia cocos (strain MD-104) TaxID=742152 RepID=A0A2H3JPN8_WOLCO|nr:hypothetical protein WOLCODRAFT_162519 [Wolfiporia cocos MD-104 SS10]
MGNSPSRRATSPPDDFRRERHQSPPPSGRRRWFKLTDNEQALREAEYRNLATAGSYVGHHMHLQPQPQIFWPEQYRYMPPPAPPSGFPHPQAIPLSARPVIPNLPTPGAPTVVPNVMPGLPQVPLAYAGMPQPPPQPVIPTAFPQPGGPVIPDARMAQLPAQVMPEPNIFPEPTILSEPTGMFYTRTASSDLSPSSLASRSRTPTPPPRRHRGIYRSPHYEPADPRLRPESILLNPLPRPPEDIFASRPEMALLLDSLRRPLDEARLKRALTLPAGGTLNVAVTSSTTPSSAGRNGHQRKGSLFSVFGSRRRREEDEDQAQNATTQVVYAMPGVQVPDGRTAFVYTQTPTSAAPVHSNTPVPMPVPEPALAPRALTPHSHSVLRIEATNDLGGLAHASPHRVHYERRTYPSAAHLFEAMKFLGGESPASADVAELIRNARSVEEARTLADAHRAHVRPDWPHIMYDKMDECLYQKMVQHPVLRRLLLSTGLADLVYADLNDATLGDGPLGRGANELGKALMRVRERLRAEGLV